MVTDKGTLVGKKGRIIHNLVFLILLIGIAYYYNYHNILFKKPQSVHNWRQSDCASLTLSIIKTG
jgi:hypothetical protein